MSVGEVLRQARAESGRSVEDVSRATRIRGQLIREIENDDFSGCGGSVYARGHIRSIAAQLGLDPAPLLAEFDRTHGASGVPGAREVFEHEVIALPERKGPNWTAALAVAAAVMLVIALVSLFNAGQPSPVADPGAGLPTSSPSPSVSPSAPAPVATDPGPIAGNIDLDGVTVVVRIVNDRSWVAAKVDGKATFGKTLAAPDQIEFKGTSLVHLTIGNAGAVQLIVNGRDLGTPGRAGQVLRLDFTPGDPGAGSAG